MGRLGTESAFEVLARAKAMEAAGSKVIHLEIGEPDFPTAPHIIEAAVEALRAGQTHYVPAPGIPPLREAVAEFLERTGRMRITPDRVVVTPGAKPIMFYTIMALCGELMISSLVRSVISRSSSSVSMRKPFRSRSGTGTGTAPANAVIDSYIGKLGSG